MNHSMLDNHLANQNLDELLIQIKKAGHSNSFKHKDGYIIVKKPPYIQLRVLTSPESGTTISIVPVGKKDIVYNVLIVLFLCLFGGIFLLLALAYMCISFITFVLSMPRANHLKLELEQCLGIIR